MADVGKCSGRTTCALTVNPLPGKHLPMPDRIGMHCGRPKAERASPINEQLRHRPRRSRDAWPEHILWY